MVTMNPPEWAGAGWWRHTWTSDLEAPRYTVIVNGVVRMVGTRQNHLGVYVPADDVSIIDVTDADGAPGLAAHDHVLLSWPAVSGAGQYRVDRLVAAAYVPVGYVADIGRAAYTWRSNPVKAETATEFRVVPLAGDGNDGTPASHVVTLARHPVPPAVTRTLDEGTRRLTIAAA